jgi:growth factor-regulated tyrosine kinase substrate
MESCVKNCGVLIHDEVATKAFMEEMRELVKQTTDDNIKNKVRLIILPQLYVPLFAPEPDP